MGKIEINQNKFQHLLAKQRDEVLIHKPWWHAEELTSVTYRYLAILFVLSNIIVSPIFFKNLTASYASSGSLLLLVQLAGAFGVSPEYVFALLTIIALSVLPLLFYLFARKLFVKDELAAFVATLLFLLPNPFFSFIPVMLHPLLNGDGSHIVAFPFVIGFLFYFQAYLRQYIPLLAIISALVGGLVIIISPFVAFHLFLFAFLFMIAEGFRGEFRAKMNRFFIVVGGSLFLPGLWYYPLLTKSILVTNHLNYVTERVLSVAPFLIPFIFIICVGLFFIFNKQDTKERLFIVFTFFLVEVILFSTASFLNLQGFFHPERFLLECSFAFSLLTTYGIISGVTAYWNNKLTGAQRREWHEKVKRLKVLIWIGVAAVTLAGFFISWGYTNKMINPISFNIGVGGFEQVVDFNDIFSVVVSFISLSIFVLLVYIISRYPARKN